MLVDRNFAPQKWRRREARPGEGVYACTETYWKKIHCMFRQREVSQPQWASDVPAIDEKFSRSSRTTVHVSDRRIQRPILPMHRKKWQQTTSQKPECHAVRFRDPGSWPQKFRQKARADVKRGLTPGSLDSAVQAFAPRAPGFGALTRAATDPHHLRRDQCPSTSANLYGHI